MKNIQSCYEELMCILLLIASKMASMRPDEVEELEGNVGRVLSRIELEREERRGGKTMRKSFYDTNNNPSLFTAQKNQPNLCKLIPFIPKHIHPRFCVFSLARFHTGENFAKSHKTSKFAKIFLPKIPRCTVSKSCLVLFPAPKYCITKSLE